MRNLYTRVNNGYAHTLPTVCNIIHMNDITDECMRRFAALVCHTYIHI